MQGRQRAPSGCGAVGAGVAVVPPGAKAGQQVPAEHHTIHLYLGILWARGEGQVRPLATFSPLPTRVLSSFLPSSEGSESWDESRLSARARSPSVGKSSNSSRRCRLRCRSRSRSLALRALSSCSWSLCGDPVSHERGLSWAALLPHRTSRAMPGLSPPSPGCEAEHGAGGSAWWNGTAPRPAEPAASAAPGSTGAELSCGRAGGNNTGVSHREPRALPTPTPPLSPYPAIPVLLQRVVHRPAEETRVISTAATHRRHPSTHPSIRPALTGRCPRPGATARGRERRSRARPQPGRAGGGAGGAPGTRPPGAAPGCCWPRAPWREAGGGAESRALIGCGAPRAADVTSAGKQIQAGKRVLQI